LKAHASGDQAALQVATNFMMKAIDGSVDEDDRWEKIDWAVESVRKLIDSIQKHQVQTAQIMTLMQAQALFTNLAMSVRKGFVGLAAQTTDERMKKLIQAALHLVAAEFQRAANMPDPLASISKETMLQ
jgi:L-ribulose-5-phosphate 3-epimerase UlaE